MSVPQRYQVSVGSPYASEGEPGTANRSSSSFTYIEWITPLFISYGCNGGLGVLQCRCAKAPEDAYSVIHKGAPIQVTDTYGSGTPTVFDGIVQKVNYKISGAQTEFNIIAYCAGDDLLRRICLQGQLRLSHTREQNLWDEGITGSPESLSTTTGSDDTIVTDNPMIFNPGGEPNMSKQQYHIDSDTTTKVNIFDVPFRNQVGPGGELKSDYWTLKKALKHLLVLTNTDWCLDTTQWNDDALDNFFDSYGDPVITNINLEGKPLLAALDALLTPHNFIFYIDPRPNSSAKKQKFFINFKGSGENVKTLILSAKGTSAHGSTANLISLDLTEDCTPVVNNLIALGEQKVFTILAHTAPTGNELKLVKAWKDSELVWAYDADGTTVNPFDVVFRRNYCHPVGVGQDGTAGIGRMWIVNQGEVKGEPLEDVGKKLADPPDPGANSINPRRLMKPEVYQQSAAGGLLKREHIVVEMSLDDGSHWAIVTKDWYEILPDGMGIVFTNPKLERLGRSIKTEATNPDSNYWKALNGGNLQIRILCSVKSDERVRKVIDNTGDTVPLATQRMFSNDGYRKLIYDTSISETVYDSLYNPLQTAVDDTTKLEDITKQQAKLTDKLMIHGTAVVTFDNIGDWVPGMTISGITGRGITFSSGKLPTIVKVVYDLVAQHCQLALDNHDTALVIQAKAVSDAQNRREAKLGIGGLVPMAGHHGPLDYANETPSERREERYVPD